jgi:hypothetical protein
MKTFRKTIMLMILLLSITTFSSHATSIMSDLPSGMYGKLDSPISQKQFNRLEEIKLMDLKKLNRKERKELRHEVRSIQKVQSEGSGGIYLSVGAIIIIILLLILIL